MNFSDESTRRLYAHLLERASVPYFAMLDTWIRRGEIRDPYDEFMVQERKDVFRSTPDRPDLVDEYPLCHHILLIYYVFWMMVHVFNDHL
jgi:hypothetical protein